MPCLLPLDVKTLLPQGAQIARAMRGVVSPESALLRTAIVPANPKNTRELR